MTLDRRLTLFVTLAAIFTTSLLIGDVIGNKVTQFSLLGLPITLSVGFIPFPITFLLTDLLNEFYGKRAARVVTWIGFGMACFAFLVISVALLPPWAPFTQAPDYGGVTQVHFDNVFGGSRRILISSLIAYLFAQFTDIAIFHLIKARSHNRFLWLRATGSTIVSQLIDTVIIQSLAWYGLMSTGELINLITSSYFTKVGIAVGLTPLIYAGHALLERGLGLKRVELNDAGEPVTGG